MLPEEIMNATSEQQITDYSLLLNAYGLAYQETGYYWQVGEITLVQGWILHLSVIKTQVTNLLHMLVPELAAVGVPFKVVKDKEVADQLLLGTLGYTQLGKIAAIYPADEIMALRLANRLIEITADFKGPGIPTDARLGGIVYTRYGSFNPVMGTDVNGHTDRYIYNKQGQLVKDNCTIPFTLPKDLTWPFATIADHKGPAGKRLLNGRYLTAAVIKSDAKGQVFNGWWIKDLLHIIPCIIKQGKKNMWTDGAERDICERLRWQYELHTALAGVVPLPKVFGLFTEQEDTYLAMEFIKGSSLHERIEAIYQDGNKWEWLPVESKLKLLGYLLKILEIVKTLHDHGYVHRDLATGNFLIDKEEQIFLIDNELMYDSRGGRPSPPFGLGSPGFTSPEQMMVATPTLKEDIYGIGGSMTAVFTGLLPVKFSVEDALRLQENLYFFTGNEAIAALIAGCLQPEPGLRPGLAAINTILLQYRETLLVPPPAKKAPDIPEKLDPVQLGNLIEKALRGLSQAPMLMAGALWVSKTGQTESHIDTEQFGYCIQGGLHDGIGGIAYVIAKARIAGYAVPETQRNYEQGWAFIQQNYLQQLPEIIPGLYEGAAGIAVALAAGIESGLLESNEQYQNWIQQCLQIAPTELHVANGIAGQGLALMQCASCLDPEWSRKLLRQLARTLVKYQQKDGSWTRMNDEGKGNKKSLGFARGIAGITFFLLTYADFSQDEAVLQAAKKALDWLNRQTRKKEDTYHWYAQGGIPLTNPWLNDGFSGIALTYIKAYEVFNDPLYEQIATGTLKVLTPFALDNNFTQARGLAGVGEVYLEAHRVFNTANWQQRADWIAQLLAHTYQPAGDDGIYWTEDLGQLPAAGFMSGNSGVLHFLLCYLQPGKLVHPLFPVKA